MQPEQYSQHKLYYALLKHKLYYCLLFKHVYFKEAVTITVLPHVTHQCHLLIQMVNKLNGARVFAHPPSKQTHRHTGLYKHLDATGQRYKVPHAAAALIMHCDLT
jgi:hypothetical protein